MIKNATNPTIEYSLPNGIMDIKIYNLAKEITIQFIDELNTKGFLKQYVTKEEHMWFVTWYGEHEGDLMQ